EVRSLLPPVRLRRVRRQVPGAHVGDVDAALLRVGRAVVLRVEPRSLALARGERALREQRAARGVGLEHALAHAGLEDALLLRLPVLVVERPSAVVLAVDEAAFLLDLAARVPALPRAGHQAGAEVPLRRFLAVRVPGHEVPLLPAGL